ncbi:citrate synthase-lysine N-methyltransferase CSKMT, mitochondrial-like [Patiria miniata]|uniref:Methyltransferase domain-containing protein n=1 Tax=Patiria miniata TaxID=46514 RepID=A0A914BHF4_PATMI|nr:citrate synthase-lysine N-methyltransferase CSKMT, mitochondrial-like [Patiria miniata]
MAAPIRHVRFWCTLQKSFNFDVDVVCHIPGVRYLLYPGRCRRKMIRFFSSTDMGKREYWDTFYAKRNASCDPAFDWFFTHDVANRWLAKCIFAMRTTGPANGVVNILELGCGTSTLASNLLKDNVDVMSLVCADFSPRAIRQAQSISRRICSSNKESIQFVVADASRLPFRNNHFDVVFEKGTFDAMLNSNNSDLARMSFSETVRVLNSRGTLLQFSDENPDLRLSFLEEALRESGVDRNQASVTFQDVGSSYGVEYFLYATKLSKS